MERKKSLFNSNEFNIIYDLLEEAYKNLILKVENEVGSDVIIEKINELEDTKSKYFELLVEDETSMICISDDGEGVLFKVFPQIHISGKLLDLKIDDTESEVYIKYRNPDKLVKSLSINGDTSLGVREQFKITYRDTVIPYFNHLQKEDKLILDIVENKIIVNNFNFEG